MPLLLPSGPAYVALLSAFFALASSVTHTLSCLPCDLSKCKVAVCKGSKVLGVCGCCKVCARQRNEPCGGMFGYQGTCDRGLTCVGSGGPYVGVCEAQPLLQPITGPKNVLLAVSSDGDFVKGSSVTFTCNSSGSNPPTSYIIFINRTIVARKKIGTISNIQPSDSGTYYCQAWNNISTVNSPGVTVDVYSQPLLQPITDMFFQCGRPEPEPLQAFPWTHSGVEMIGGRGSFPRDHPWQVSLQRRTKGSSKPFKHACGGVLIASCWVLTAAHCVNSTRWSMDMQVVLGGVYIKRKKDSEQVIPVVRAIVHGDYRTSSPDGQFVASHNDIALLQLNVTKSPHCALETRYVKTACLPNQLFPDGKECVVSGWGLTGNNKRSNRLLEGEAPLISNERCIAYQGRLDDTMICAGHTGGGADACKGDSGGPLMCEQDGIHYIVGLVSWGPRCNALRLSNTPGVYTNVYRYVDWIKRKMSNDDDDEDYDYSYDDD